MYNQYLTGGENKIVIGTYVSKMWITRKADRYAMVANNNQGCTPSTILETAGYWDYTDGGGDDSFSKMLTVAWTSVAAIIFLVFF